MRTAIVLALSLTVTAVTASAEEAPALPIGKRLRVTTSGAGGFTGTFQGTLAKLDPQELTLVDGDKGAVMTMPSASVTRVQVLTGTHHKTRKGLLMGLAVGAALGAVAGSTDSGTGSGCSLDATVYKPCTAGTAAAWAAATGVSGAAIGALIGRLRHVEVWNDVALERIHVRAAPVARGGALEVTVALGN